MEFVVLVVLSGLIAACFTPMFSKHARRKKRLQQIQVEGASLAEIKLVDQWKDAARKHANFKNAAAFCFAFMWIFPFLAVGLFFLPFMANAERRRALKLKEGLPDFPSGFGWLEGK